MLLCGSVSVRVACEHCSADGSGVEAEFGGDDLGGFKTWLKSPAFYFLDDGIEDE